MKFCGACNRSRCGGRWERSPGLVRQSAAANRRSPQHVCRAATTLLELIIASTAGAILMAGLSGSLYIASQSFNQDTATADQLTAQQILSDLMADVNQAIRFTQRTANAIRFTVPDRTGDSLPEVIGYSWGGSAGDPLTYEYNGSSVALASGVQQLNFSYLTRIVTAPLPPPPNGADKLLLVVTNILLPGSGELSRQQLFESWGYTVTLVDDGDSQTNFNSKLAENDVVYVSQHIASSSLGTKLTGATIGVVNEEAELTDELGFSSSRIWPFDTDLTITDNGHYITSQFAVGPLALVSSDQSMTALSGTLSTGLQSLGDWGTDKGLVVLDSGATLYGGGSAAGRRVALPWGGGSFAFGQLTADGTKLLRLAIEWAGGAGGQSGPKLLLLVADASSPTVEESSHESLIETWGYSVTLATAAEPQSVYDTYPGNFKVVYVPSSVSYADVASKLKFLPIGVVNEVTGLTSYLGFTSGSSGFTGTSTDIVDNTHEITSPLGIGNLTIMASSQSLRRFVNTMGPGFHTLSTGPASSDPTMMTLDSGDELLWGGNAPARRVMLPWSSSSTFDVNALTADGKTLMQRSIEWAAGADVTGLLAHWKLDETSGTNAADSSGGGHNGTYENGPTLGVAAVVGAGARFDGVNDRVRVPDDPVFSSHTSTGLTVSAWIKVHAFNTDGSGQPRQPIVSKGYWSDWEWALYVYDDGRAEFTTWQADGSAHSGSIGPGVVAGEWVHITGAIEPDVANRLYVNGIEVASDTTFAGSAHDGSRDLFIATREDGQYLNATIDDVRIYGRVLATAEISDLFAAGAGGSASGVVFEEFTEAKLTSDGSSFSISKPSGTATGDLLVMAVSTDGNTSSSLAPPAGWTQVDRGQSGGAVTFGVWWKLAGGSESSSYNVTWSGSERAYGWIMRFTGHDPADPIDTWSAAGGTSSSPTSTPVISSVDNAMIVRMGGFDDDDITVDDPGLTGHTAITMDETGTSSSTSGGAGYVIQPTAGNSGTSSFSLTASEQYRTVTISIAPAP